jgi:hypothetical protein
MNERTHEILRDEFAIGFGEYLDSLTAQDMGTLSIKELLIIYKKEKENGIRTGRKRVYLQVLRRGLR